VARGGAVPNDQRATAVRVADSGVERVPGVWFFSLDATNPLAVRAARRSHSLPYFDARISCAADGGENTPTVKYSSRRTHRGAPPAELDAEYRPVGKPFTVEPGTLDYFLTERYCLYSADPEGKVYRCEIAHPTWPLQPAEATVRRNTMTRPLGFDLPDEQPLLHYAYFLPVIAWKPVSVGARGDRDCG